MIFLGKLELLMIFVVFLRGEDFFCFFCVCFVFFSLGHVSLLFATYVGAKHVLC